MPISQIIDITCDECGVQLNGAEPTTAPPTFIGLTTNFPSSSPNVTLCNLKCLSAWTAAQIAAIPVVTPTESISTP